jgi:hypothetical protein
MLARLSAQDQRLISLRAIEKSLNAHNITERVGTRSKNSVMKIGASPVAQFWVVSHGSLPRLRLRMRSEVAFLWRRLAGFLDVLG